MAKQALNGVLQHLRKVAAVQTYHGLSDRELLERFVGNRDEAAFTIVIERHGPMVLGVCQRALPNFHDAEDACQATFLVLARKAASVRKKASLSSWLHGVACRVAANLKRDHARRKIRERGVATPAQKDPAADVSWRELQAILDEELQRLPERYRVPLILCYLECITRDEAAQQLGLSPTTLRGRLERARNLLRECLTKRGLTLSAALFAATLGESVAQAALSPTFVVSSTKVAILLAAGLPLTESAVAPHVLALTQEVIKSMFLTKLKLGTAAVLCAGLFVALIGGSFTSLGIAQEAKPKVVYVDPISGKVLGSSSGNSESDADFIRRISKDLRGTDPTPTEIHFFVASKDAGRRQKLIDLFIQERQANKKADVHRLGSNDSIGMERGISLNEKNFDVLPAKKEMSSNAHPPGGMGTLQKEFYKALHTAKDKGDVAKITQAYLDRLVDFVKTNPKSRDIPDAIRQIVFVYESQGKTLEAGAWRGQLPKEKTAERSDGDDVLKDLRMRERILKEQQDQKSKEAEKELLTPPAGLKGVIEEIDLKGGGTLLISIGSDTGVAKNHTLDVYRLKPTPLYLGKICIVNVWPQKAVARRVGVVTADTPTLTVGDNVTSPLTKPTDKQK